MLQQPSADDRAGGDPDSGGGTPQADRGRPLAAGREDVGQQRQGGREHHRGTEPHHRPGPDQLTDGGGERACEAGRAEHPKAGQQHSLASQPVGQAARDQHKRGEDQVVGVHHPLQVRGSGAGLPHQAGQRHVHDRDVQADDVRRQAQGEQRDALTREWAVSGRCPAPFSLVLACEQFEQGRVHRLHLLSAVAAGAGRPGTGQRFGPDHIWVPRVGRQVLRLRTLAPDPRPVDADALHCHLLGQSPCPGPLTGTPAAAARTIWTGVAQTRHPKVDLLGGIFSGRAKARRCHRTGAERRTRGSGRVLVLGRQPRCGWPRRACRGRG